MSCIVVNHDDGFAYPWRSSFMANTWHLPSAGAPLRVGDGGSKIRGKVCDAVANGRSSLEISPAASGQQSIG